MWSSFLSLGQILPFLLQSQKPFILPLQKEVEEGKRSPWASTRGAFEWLGKGRKVSKADLSMTMQFHLLSSLTKGEHSCHRNDCTLH